MPTPLQILLEALFPAAASSRSRAGYHRAMHSSHWL
jgi:hypothetical protein